MTTLNIAHFKAQLLAQRATLRAQLATLRGGELSRAEASAAHYGMREDSQAQTATEKDLEFALDARDTAELNAIDAALQRMAAGTYGECVDCGASIAPARLQATPEATRCLHCQEAAERA